MRNLLLSSITFILLLNLVACTPTEEEIHNHITIDIETPINNSTISSPNLTAIKINISAEVELHDIEVTLKDASNNAIAPFNPLDIHTHASSTTINETIDLSSYPAGETFTLTVEACEDHDCAEKVIESSSFSI